MTNFYETPEADAFVATADSRRTSPEVMRAIARCADTVGQAVALWEGDLSEAGVYTTWGMIVTAVCDIATRDGAIDDCELYWGDRPLSAIRREIA